MRKRVALVAAVMMAALLSISAAAAWAGDAGEPTESVVQAFEKFKALEGTWKGSNSQGQEVEMTFEVTGNGTAVYSRYRQVGNPEHDMATVYHLEGPRLMLTHYCAAGNQPRMISTGGLKDQAIRFEFLDIGNANASEDGHMHKADYEFISKDRFKTNWNWYQEGDSRFTVSIEAQRVE